MDDITAPTPEPLLPPGDPAAQAPARRRRRGPLIAAGILAAVVLVGVPSGVALYLGLARGAGDVVGRMVPDDSDIYVTAYLDPSLSQKLALQGLMQHFPAVHGQPQLQVTIDKGMDAALRPEGLTFEHDVQPWLGSQVALAMRLGSGTPTAVIIASSDDARATATLGRIRTTAAGRADHWSEQPHGGVSVSVGTPAGGHGTPIAYAYLDHTAVIGNSAAEIDEVIDTDHGRHAALRTSAAYTETLRQLPSDRVALAWASGPGVVHALGSELDGGGALAFPGLLSAWDANTAALRSVGVALSAQPGGLAADLAVLADPSKLGTAARQALASPPPGNAALDWVPADADGFLAVAGVRDSLQSAVQGLSAPAGGDGLDLGAPLRAVGIAGPGGLLSHLTGDLAVEVRSSAGSALPGGALLLGVDDPAAVRAVLGRLASTFSGGAAPRTQTDRGIAITSVPIDGLDGAGVAPAYAVADGMAVIGSSPAEVRAAIDAHAGGSRVVALPYFTAAGAYSPGQPILYLDLDRIRTAIERALPADLRRADDGDLRANLEHLHALRITGRATVSVSSVRLFLVAG